MNPASIDDLIPLDKSWIIRMGFLDIISGRTDILEFLNSQTDLNDDLIALKRVAETWNTLDEINVGESGTIYRFFKFASWKLGMNKKFILEGTLKDRVICDDPTIVDWPVQKLLTLDNGTSQWASAAILMGNSERVENAPYKLKVTGDAVEVWHKARNRNEPWVPRLDQTISNQAKVFIQMMKGEKTEFVSEQAEDYCFSRIFGFITDEEGERRWPALRSHETDRIAEMEKVIHDLEEGRQIISRDHRVVQAVGMYQKLHKMPSTVIHAHAVNKSWPLFWQFLDML